MKHYAVIVVVGVTPGSLAVIAAARQEAKPLVERFGLPDNTLSQKP